MAESSENTGERGIRRRGFPDPLTVVVGLAALFASAYVLTDGAFGFPSIEPRWLLAGGVVLLGVLTLLGSIRTRRR